MNALDLYQLPLTGTQLIEASAGTGKTWTIAGLYLRLLLETGRRVDEILVVTFTRAATAELRERLRARLVQVERALAAGESDDEFCRWALDRFAGEARKAAQEALARARAGFDEAAIFTIHGFCQRVLAELQAPALLAEPEVVPDERELLPRLVQEAWIRHCQDAALAALLHENGIGLDVVLEDVRALLRKPYLVLRGGGDEAALARLVAAKAALRARWQAEGEAIRDDLRRADGLSQAQDAYKDVEPLLAELAAWLADEPAELARVALLTPRAFAERPGRKKSGHTPQHAFWQELQQVLEAAHGVCQAFRLALIADVRAVLRQHKEQQGLLTYQDLLSLLAEAVADEAAAAGIRRRYSAALIDEFQDTDPLQFRVFDRVYNAAGGSLPLFLVGDPKQAIYSFRGADIFTYLRARETAVARHSLHTNRRSLPELVAAVNTLFQQNRNAFLFSDLRFQPVAALPPAQLPVFADGRAPLHGSLLPCSEKTLNKERAAALSAARAAEDIVALLADAAAGRARLPDGQGGLRPLAAADIAVLVPTHRHGRLMAEALTARGVAVVQRSEESVFATREAQEFRLVLEAVLAPGREGLLKAALLTTLLGWSVAALAAAQDDDRAWSGLCERLLQLRERWQQQGFMAMWEALLAEFEVFERLLPLAGGERRLTNLRHLATLLQQQAEAEPVPERQLAWLCERLHGAESAEDSQLRLESDAARVQILTVHVSKGLEYPVVFCPFLWEGRHARAGLRAEYRSGADSLLDIGSERFAQAHERMTLERLAENLRVLYVALTRAKYRCQFVWGACTDSDLAALTWLLLGQGVPAEHPEAMRNVLRLRTGADYQAALERLHAACPQGFSWDALGEPGRCLLHAAPAAPAAPVLPAFSRPLQRLWRVSSFTGLAEDRHEVERPDHDLTQSLPALPASPPQGLHGFPRGAAAGVFWHALLEECVMGRVADRPRFVADMLKKHGLEPVWQPLVETWLARWLETPLGEEGLVLSRLAACRAEMEFVYPVRALQPAALRALPEVPPPYREALAQLDFATLSGYLRGFIDLVCRHRDRYYVIDYKTNWLGPDEAAYAAEGLTAAMAGAHYYLQYWLYTLAVHRHLRTTLQERYDYARDFGGVRYLFLRGLDAATQGVYAAKPSPALIAALDRLLEQGP